MTRLIRVREVGVLIELSNLASDEHIVITEVAPAPGETYKIAGTVGAPTAANASIVIHVVVEAHWEEVCNDVRRKERSGGWWFEALFSDAIGSNQRQRAF